MDGSVEDFWKKMDDFNLEKKEEEWLVDYGLKEQITCTALRLWLFAVVD